MHGLQLHLSLDYGASRHVEGIALEARESESLHDKRITSRLHT
jgi:hypothetical protein